MFSKFAKSLPILALSIILLLISSVSVAHAEEKSTAETTEKSTSFDPAKVIMEHIMDAHEFHFATVGEHNIAIPLPVIVYSKKED